MGKRIQQWSIALGGLAAVIAVAIIVMVVKLLTQVEPAFESLQTHPDPTLRGTLAYYDSASSCIRAVAVAGTPSKQVYCVPPQSEADAKANGKHVGIHIVWLPEGRLELTMFKMLPGKRAPHFEPAWQRIVDVATLSVVEVPLSEVDDDPTPVERPRVDPLGNRLETESADGHATIKVIDVVGRSRTLLDVEGPFESYSIAPAFYSPDFKYALSDDGQVLITTFGEQPQTRSLTSKLQSGYGYDAIDWFAVTDWDLLRK